MTPSLRFKFILLVLITAFAVYVVAPIPNKPRFLDGFRTRPGIDLAGGAELRYKVLFEPGFTGDRGQATREAADVLRRRIDPQHLKEPKITPSGDDAIVVQLAGIDADGLRELKSRVGTMGKLQFFAAAPQVLQERFARDGVAPAGYKAAENFLVEEHPVVEGRHLVHAEPQQAEGGRWVTAFELDAEGAKRFDEAAERLYRQVPRGRMVIVLDDRVRSAPVVQSPAFRGRGQISGGKE
jgi:preprotein translocase subunit SecD